MAKTVRVYCTTYCNKAHNVANGKPVSHECRIIPPDALRAEMAGGHDEANRLLRATPARWMRRGERTKQRK